MKIIDAHVHTDFKDQDFLNEVKKSGVDFSFRGLKKEMDANNVTNVISMGYAVHEKTSVKLESIREQGRKFDRIAPIVGINPFTNGPETLEKIKKSIKTGEIKGIKIYLGYFPFYSYHKVYYKYYEIAEKRNVPVIFHTGDTLFKGAKLRYSLPLTVDEVAVDFPKVKFVIAHLGTPRISDAAEVVYKNSNVYADLSGMFMGNVPRQLESEWVKKVRNAFYYVGDSKSFLYGSDWPLISMDKYIAFIKKCIPEKHHEDVFYNNAKKLFRI